LFDEKGASLVSRRQCLVAFWFLYACAYATAQVPVPSITCPGIVLGQISINFPLPTSLSTSLTPGIPVYLDALVVTGVVGSSPQLTAGTYSTTEQCSITVGAFTSTFNFLVTTVISGNGQQQTYAVSTSGFIGSFNLGAGESLSLNEPAAKPVTLPPSFGGVQIVTITVLLSPTPAATPLPPSIILTLTGLAGAGLLAARRKRYFI
jgi:hypothetical protein